MFKAKLWNHLSWPKCLHWFWVYWRRNFNSNHMNPLNADSCPLLTKRRKSTQVSKMPALVTSTIWKIFWILSLLLLFSPIVTIIISPYLLTCYCNLKNNSVYYAVFIASVILTLIWFPVFWTITILFYFYILWNMTQYQKHAKEKLWWTNDLIAEWKLK